MDDTSIITVSHVQEIRPTLEQAGITQIKEEDGRIHHYDSSGKHICGAKTREISKKNLGYCRRSPLNDRNRCALHGGKSLMGAQSGRYKHGGYSRDLPERLEHRYNLAIKDKRLMELRDENALMKLRIAELLARLDTGESGEVWSQIGKTYSKLREAAFKNDQDEFAAALTVMGSLIKRGQSDYAAWDEVFKAVTARRKIIETERKRMVDLKQMMTAEQAMAMLSYVVNAIKSRAYKHFQKDQADAYMADVSKDISAFIAQNGGFSSGRD